MPSTSKSQQRLMAAAEHGATFPMAKKLRSTMSHQQLHDFAVGPMINKPEHAKMSDHFTPTPQNFNTGVNKHLVQPKESAVVNSQKESPLVAPSPKTIKGQGSDVVHSNMGAFKHSGLNELDATKRAIKLSKKGHPNRHKNLGKFLHPKKSNIGDTGAEG